MGLIFWVTIVGDSLTLSFCFPSTVAWMGTGCSSPSSWWGRSRTGVHEQLSTGSGKGWKPGTEREGQRYLRRRWWGCSRRWSPSSCRQSICSTGWWSRQWRWGLRNHKELKTEEQQSAELMWFKAWWIGMPNWRHSRCRALAIAHDPG